MFQKKSTDMLEGSPLWSMVFFAMPMIIGNLFQQFYNMADSAIVGKFVSENALAAVGASYSLTNVFICIAIGGGVGASVLTSQYLGGRDYGSMKTSAYTALTSFFAVSVVLAVFGVSASPAIMVWLRTPANIFAEAVLYLRIYFVGLPFLFMYNVLASVFNALGKSKIPLYFLIFCHYGPVYGYGDAYGRCRCGAGYDYCSGYFGSDFFFCTCPVFERSAGTGRFVRWGNVGTYGEDCPAIHLTAVHCIHRNAAGPVRGQWVWLRCPGRLLSGKQN